MKLNKHKMPDRKWKVAKEREFTNKEADATRDYVASTSEFSLLFTGEATSWSSTVPTQQLQAGYHCPSSHNSLYICKAHRHRAASKCTFHCLSLSTPRDYKYPAKSNIKKLACLGLRIEYSITAISGCQREIYSRQRCQHPAASLAEYSGRQTHVLFHM